MDTSIREQITNLRHTLHACPEISGQEKQTKETLQNFLTAHTSLELNDCGGGFYAAHREGAEMESHSGQTMMHWRFRKEEPLISADTTDMHRRSAA